MKVKGYLGNLPLEETKNLAKNGIYVFNAKSILGREHLEYAYMKAGEFFKRGKNIAKSFHIEMMLILTGKRQIKDAMRLVDVKNADSIGVISERDFEIELERDDSVLECNEDKLKYLGIKIVGDNPCDLAFENSALLYLER